MEIKQIRALLIAGILMLLSAQQSIAQQNTGNTTNSKKPDEKKLVQLSGIITAGDGKSAIPFSTVHIIHTYRGTIAGNDGFYSLVVAEKDTVEYEALGFKKVSFIIPTGTIDQKMNHSVSLETDTLSEQVTDVFAYLTKEEFKRIFLDLKLKDDLTDRAKKNLDQESMRELYESLARDGQENQLYTLQQIASSSYYAGGQKNYALLGNGVAVPTSLLNPFAWAEFIKAVKEGKYKKKKKDRDKDKNIKEKNNYDY
jgi:hypothetical protein